MSSPSESAQNPPPSGVFLSYSRDDIAFVERLHAGLEAHGVDTHLDREDIEKSEDWWERLTQLITESDAVVFVLSPTSVASAVCRKEVEFAHSLNKRLIPVVAARLDGAAPPAALLRLNYIFFVADERAGASGDFDDALAELLRTLQMDIGWIREHTRIGAIARRWESRSEPRDMLLRGVDLEAAERWLTARPASAPDPTPATVRMVAASQRAATRRLRQWVIGSLTVAVGALGLATFALIQWNRAEAELRTATAQRLAVQSRAALVDALQPGGLVRPDVDRSVLVALESLRLEPSVEADMALRAALLNLPGPARELRLDRDLELAAIGSGGAWVAANDAEGRALIFTDAGSAAPTADQRAAIATAPTYSAINPPPEAEDGAGSHGRYALRDPTGDADVYSGTARELYDRGTGERLAVLPHEWYVNQRQFRSDGAFLMTVTGFVSADASESSATRLYGSTLYVWEIPDGHPRTELSFAARGGIGNFTIDPEGDWIALQTGFDDSGSSIVVMPIWPDLLAAEACRRARRNLSPTEVAEYLPGRAYSGTCEGLDQISE